MRNKPWALDYLKSQPQWVVENPAEVQGKWQNVLMMEKIEIEIGSGKGDYLLAKALQNPSIGFVAIEKDKNVAALAVKKFAETSCHNLKLIQADASLLPEWFAQKEVDTIYLNFSDPWLKQRYAKRRLTHHAFLARYEHILKKSGKIVLKTDNAKLFEFSLCEFSMNDWVIQAVAVDFRNTETDDPFTEYERKFHEMGHPIYRVEVVKRI